MELILLGLGLVLALLPNRLEDLIRMIDGLPVDTRRFMGLAAVAVGVFLVWLTRGL